MTTFLEIINGYGFLCNQRVKGNLHINEHSPFPDGQPHIAFDCAPLPSSFADTGCVIRCRIVSGDDLIRLAEAVNVCKRYRTAFQLEIVYLMGGRMDRPLSDKEPYTLKAVCDLINSLGAASVGVFVPHSQATSDLLYNYDDRIFKDEEQRFYRDAIIRCLEKLTDMPRRTWYDSTDLDKADHFTLVFPDEGAKKRYSKLPWNEWFPKASFVTLAKDRNERTGEILGTRVASGVTLQHNIIIDDLCDGGRTFVESAKALRQVSMVPHDDTTVSLVVAHGVFSKGIQLEGINHIVTTNSFKDQSSEVGFGVYQLFQER